MNKSALKNWIENKIIELGALTDDPTVGSQIELLQVLYDDFNLAEVEENVFTHNLK